MAIILEETSSFIPTIKQRKPPKYAQYVLTVCISPKHLRVQVKYSAYAQ